MPKERDGLYLSLIAEAIEDIRRRVGECEIGVFVADRDEQALTAFRLSIIGENANKLSNELKMRYPELPWPDMVAFRTSYRTNIIALIQHWFGKRHTRWMLLKIWSTLN